ALRARRLRVDRPCQFHAGDHLCGIYQAAVAPGSEPVIRTIPLRALAESAPPVMAMLYIPPSRDPSRDPILAGRIAALMAAGGPAPTRPGSGSCEPGARRGRPRSRPASPPRRHV